MGDIMTEEILREIADFTRLTLFENAPFFFHMIRRLNPIYAEFYSVTVYKDLSAGEVYDVEAMIPADKVKLPQFIEYKFETQAVMEMKWWRDGKLFFEDDNACDMEMTAGSIYETWCPMYRSYLVRFTNNHTSNVWLHIRFTYVLMDLALYEKIMEKIMKPLVKEVLGE